MQPKPEPHYVEANTHRHARLHVTMISLYFSYAYVILLFGILAVLLLFGIFVTMFQVLVIDVELAKFCCVVRVI